MDHANLPIGCLACKRTQTGNNMDNLQDILVVLWKSHKTRSATSNLGNACLCLTLLISYQRLTDLQRDGVPGTQANSGLGTRARTPTQRRRAYVPRQGGSYGEIAELPDDAQRGS